MDENEKEETSGMKTDKCCGNKLMIVVLMIAVALVVIALVVVSNDAPADEPCVGEACDATREQAGPASGEEGGLEPAIEPAANEAKVTILEFSDFQCPFCARGAATMAQIKEEYGDDVEIIFKEFPLSFHKNAQKAAEAAECARDQGKFWEMHDLMFANQGALGVSSLKSYAEQLGLDTDEFDSCLDSGEKAGQVAADTAEGRSMGISGTPGFIINGRGVKGAQPLEVFKEIIDEELEA